MTREYRTRNNTEQGICIKCNKNKQKRIGTLVDGTHKYSDLCSACRCEKYGMVNKRKNRHGYIKKESCEKCGFVAHHKCQMDMDHIDGNHQNNDHSNLQTLCANCHRLKTWICRETNNKIYRK